MEPRVFHLLKEFLLWEKYQIENQKHEHPKVQQQVPLTNEDLGQEEAKEDTSDEQDDAEVFNVMFQANRTSDLSGKPALPSVAGEPVKPLEGGATMPPSELPNPGPNMIDHHSSCFVFDVLQRCQRSAKDPMINNCLQVQMPSLVGYLKLAAFYDFLVQPALFDSAGCTRKS